MDSSNLNIFGNVTVASGKTITNNTVTLGNGIGNATLTLGSESSLNTSTLIVSNGELVILDIRNDNIGTVDSVKITENANLNFKLDINLNGGTADTLNIVESETGSRITINEINILNSIEEEKSIQLFEQNVNTIVQDIYISGGIKYKVSIDESHTDGIWLKIKEYNYTGLADIVNVGGTSYSIPENIDTDIVQWIIDPDTGEKQNFLKDDLEITGNNKVIKALQEEDGIVVGDGRKLTVNNVASFEAFNNAVTLSPQGELQISNVAFKNNTSATSGGAITTVNNVSGNNSLAKIDIKHSKFNSNVAARGGAIDNYFYHSTTEGEEDYVYVDDTKFEKNQATYGGAIYNRGTKDELGNAAKMKVENSTFTLNVASSYGGAVYNSGEFVVNNSLFSINGVDPSTYLTATQLGGAIYTTADSTTTITNTNFGANAVTNAGGAIYNGGKLTIGEGTNFYNNSAASAGGAIYNSGNLSANGVSFKENRGANAGAIYTASGSTTTITNTNFSTNTATSHGGAAWLYGNTTITDSEFYGNKAFTDNATNQNYGGAIITGGASTTTITNTTFTKNSGKGMGGAIYNQGKMEINGSEFNENEVGNYIYNNYSYSRGGAIATSANSTTTIKNTSFTGNANKNPYSDVDIPESRKYYDGGAIYDNGIMYIDSSTFTNNSSLNMGGAISVGKFLQVTNSTFTNNRSEALSGDGGGAIYSYKDVSTVRIASSSFTGNFANEGGAVQIMNVGTVENVSFTNNQATSSDIKYNNLSGGAVGLGSRSETIISSSIFKNNTANTRGGAISTRNSMNDPSTPGADPGRNDNSKARLAIVNSTFVDNVAVSSGGAISNYFYQSTSTLGHSDYAYIDKSNFENNSAANGGAIYNHWEEDKNGKSPKMYIENSTFTANIATEKGGAIYNTSTMTINSSKFENNMAGTEKNDIYNIGKLDLLSGNTTMTGGITGTGRTRIGSTTADINAIVELGSEAKMQQQELTIEKGSTLSVNGENLEIGEFGTDNNYVTNEGLLKLSSGDGELRSSIIGGGTTTVTNGAKIILGGRDLKQSDFNIDENSKFTVDISGTNFDVTSDKITNNGIIELQGNSILKDELVGTGEVIYDGNIRNEKNVTQSTVTVNANKTVMNQYGNTIAANSLQGSNGKIVNEGTINLTVFGYDDTYTLGTLNGSGTTNIQVDEDTTIDLTNKTIVQHQLVINGDDTLTLQGPANSIIATGQFSNTGNLITNAEIINAVNGITNTGDLTFTGGTNKNNVTGAGDLTVTGNLTNNANIEQESVTITAGTTENSETGKIKTTTADGISIASGAKLETHGEIDTHTNGGKIANAGTFEVSLRGDAQSKNIIDGNGQLVVSNGRFDNDYDGTLGKITQSSITVASGATFTSSATAVTTGEDGIVNQGTVIFYDGQNANKITGENGKLEIAGTVTNAANVTQKEVEVTSGKLTNDADTTISATTLTNKAEIENSGTITGTNNTVVNETGAKITNKDNGTLKSTNAIINRGTIETDAGKIETTAVNNDGGTLNLTGGDLSGYNVIGTSTQTSNVNIFGNITLKEGKTITNNTVTLGNGTDDITLKLEKENSLNKSTLVIKDKSTLDVRNDEIGEVQSVKITEANWKLNLDIDLQDTKADKLNIDTVGTGSQATISNIKLLSNRASKTTVVIANKDITNGVENIASGAVIEGFLFNYKVVSRVENGNTVLDIEADGYGGYAGAVYDALSEYEVSEEEDDTKAWILNTDTLSKSMVVSGNNKTLKSSTNLSGVKTGTYTLTINDLKGYNGFENAITVQKIGEETGTLNVSSVTFSGNTGEAVIKNEGTVNLSSATFRGNNADKDIVNEGELNIKGLGATIERGINGNGKTTVESGAELVNKEGSEISQKNIEVSGKVSNGGTISTTEKVKVNGMGVVETSASGISAGSGIDNEGVVVYTGGENKNVISGTGNLTIDGTVTNETGKTISQSSITINSGKSLSADVSDITTSEKIGNEGVLRYTGEGTNKNNIEGSGNLTIDGTVTNETGKTISQSSITINSGKRFTANVNDITTGEDGIENEGLLMFNGTGINTSTITGSGDLIIDGEITNNSDTKIKQKNVIISTNKSLRTSASDVETTMEITNNGDLVFTGGTNNNVISGTSGILTVEGDLVNKKTISQKTININEGMFINDDAIIFVGTGINIAENAGLTTDAGKINENVPTTISNEGELIFTGGKNVNTVTGDKGTLEIVGTVENDANIKQSSVTVTTGKLTNNEGKEISATKIVNKAAIENKGTMTAEELTNNEDATVDNKAKLDITTMTNEGTVNNENGAEIKATVLTNSGAINSTGTITVTTLTNNEDATIYNAGTITSENEIVNAGTMTSNADDIVITGDTKEIQNSGTYNVTGGTISYKITGTNGTINIKDNEVTISTSVSGNNVNLSKTLILKEESYLDNTSSLTIENGATLDIENSKTQEVNPNEIRITDNAFWNLKLDIDLQNATADMLNNVAVNNGFVDIAELNIVTDKANNNKIQIADENIVNIFEKIYYFSSEKINYKVVLTGDANGSYLTLTAHGYGGLANAVYDADTTYDVVLERDETSAWILGNNTLKEHLTINGYNKILTTSTADGSYLSGLNTSTYTLTVKDLVEYSGFENAINVQAGGSLNVSTVTFMTNTGKAVITNEGTVTLSSVTFTGNSADIDIANNGTLNISGEGVTLERGINGDNGTTKIESGVTLVNGESSTISQKDIEITGTLTNENVNTNAITTNNKITIDENGLLETNASAVLADNGIVNAGTITYTGGTNANVITGTGELNINGVAENNASVKQSTITVTEGASLTTSASNVETTIGITNNGELIFTDGTNKNEITGNGYLISTGDVTSNGNITQSSVTVSAGTFENNKEIVTTSGSGITIATGATLITHNLLDTYTNNGAITNNGTLEISVSGDAQSKNIIDGEGQLLITSGRFDNEYDGTFGTINQSSITVASGAVLTSSVSAITTSQAEGNGIINEGTVIFYDGENKNNITGTGKTEIAGEVENNENVTIAQKDIEITGKLTNYNEEDNAITATNKITIDENGLLETNASAVLADNGIVNAGTVTFTDGTNNNKITGDGELNVTGAVLNNGNIKQSTITVISGASLTTSADNIRATEEVTNDGDLILTEGTNKNVINGDGTTTIAENANVTNTGTMNQQEIEIDGTLINNNETSGSIKATDQITVGDNGVLVTNANALAKATNGIVNAGTVTFNSGKNINEISGDYGRLEITGTVENDANAEQYELEVTTTGKLTNNEGKTITVVKANNSGTTENKGTITAEELTNNEDATVDNKAKLDITAMTNEGIVNNESGAEIKATVLTNSGAINSTGTITVTTLTNNEDATIYNAGTITSENEIVNAGTMTSNADDIVITGDTKEIQNSGTYNVTGGTISYKITGDNTNKGTVNIRDGEVTISEFVTNNDVNLGTALILKKEDYLTGSTLTIENGATLDTINNSTAAVTTDKITIASGANWNLKLDVDLKTATGDNLVNVENLGGKATINNLNLLSDKARESKIQIADAYINAIVSPDVYTTNIRYKVKVLEENNKTYLLIEADGYGGLPQAVYDAASVYDVTDEFDYVTEWIKDPVEPEVVVNDFLKEDLIINGNNHVLLSTTNITGLKTSTHTLQINNLTEYKGFTNALIVEKVNEASGTLKVTNVTFTNNSGDAVIASSGTVILSSVTFSDNSAKIDIANNGELIITGEGTETVLERGISGEGNTTIETGAELANGENSTIAQNKITVLGTLINYNDDNEAITADENIVIGEDGSFVTNASAVRSENGIDNSGLVTFTGGTNANDIFGDGDLNIVGAVINNASVLQSTVTVAQNASLTTNANNIITTGTGIVNIGSVTFTGGTNENKITGDGELNITGVVINSDEKGSINQSTVTVTKTGSLKTNASNVETTEELANAGKVEFTGGTNKNKITGDGTLEITGAVVNDDEKGNIRQSTVTITSNGSLITDVNNIVATDGIGNDGVMTYTGEGTNKNEITGSGNLTIDGKVINSTGTAISQSSVTVNGSFTANADDITTGEEGILNEGKLIYTGGTNDNDISGAGETVIDGNVINKEETTIKQDKITVNDNAEFTTNIGDVTTDNGIANSGDMIFVGNGTNNNVITGDGNLTIEGNVINDDEKGSVNQSTVTVTKTGSLKTNASNVKTTKELINTGKVEFTGGTNENKITGDGKLEITGAVVNDDDKGNINQSTVTITSAGSLITDVNNIVATDGIEDDGAMTYTGEGTNNNIISGSGNLTIDGTVENHIGTTISLSSVTVTDGSEFTASANDITTTGDEEGNGILNDGTLIYTGGVNTSTITATEGKGLLKVEDNLTNTAAITQKEIDIKGGDFENVRTSSVTAEKITVADGSKLITDAKDLDISDSITITGEETVLNLKDDGEAEIGAVITGAGKIVKEGEGTVTLSGENGYTGTTTITGGAIRIVAESGISKEKIYMDGGKLIVNGENEVELGNKIIGTDYNTVNIEVTGSTTTLNDQSEILGNSNLVKTGEGILDLQMKSNGYIGDTEIRNGTLIGTTENINGKIIGTADETSTVKFYDADTDVVLNEIDDTDYIGTFEKMETATSTMTVTNNFHAINANIKAGTFVVNNDDTMGGSGTNFIVEKEMKVENATLKGYGNIDLKGTGDLIIGKDATFAPGNSTTTYKVNGNLIFEDNGRYDAEFGQISEQDGGHYNDNTDVTEKTTIGEDATLTLNNLKGKYYVAETIDLINSSSIEFNGYKDGEEQSEDKGDYKEITKGNVTFKDYDASGLLPQYDTRISTRVYAEDNILKLELQRKQSEYGKGDFDKSHNEQEAADAIDNVSTGNGGDITLPLDILEHFYYYKDPETGENNIPALKAALNDVAGVIHANATNLPFFNAKAEHVYDKIKERAADVAPCNKIHDRIWAEYYYNDYSVNSDDNSPKHQSTVNGFMAGFDIMSSKINPIGEEYTGIYDINGKEKSYPMYYVNGKDEGKEKKQKGYKVTGVETASQWMVGIMGGYGTSELKQKNDDKATMNDINLGFYGGYENDKWALKGMLLGGYEKYDITRKINFMNRIATSEHSGYSAALDLEAGYKIGLTDNQAKHRMYLKPFIGAIGSYVDNEGYKETGADSLNLKAERYHALTAEARAGVEVNGKVNRFGWYAKAGVRQLLTRNFNEIKLSLLDYEEQTRMYIRSAENAGTSLTGGIGADYDLSENWTVFANGLGNFAEVATNYYANIGLAYRFSCKHKEKKSDDNTEELRKMLEEKMKAEEDLKKKLAEKERELQAAKEQAAREKELQEKLQKYEANVVSEQQAQKMKEKTIKSIRISGPTFKFGTVELSNKGKDKLKEVTSEIKKYPEADILIEGHTDSVGSDDYNQKLSEDRASTMAKSLKKDYKVQNNISVIGKGEKEPIATNATKEGRAQNRRVEIILTTAE